METYHFAPDRLPTKSHWQACLQGQLQYQLSADAMQRLDASRRFLLNKIATSENLIYGINTGFGALYNQRIAADNLGQLQLNLVQSHACGFGRPLAAAQVRLMLLLKVQSLIYGHSGISPEIVQRLVAMLNEDLLPVVPSQGSLGASGDLAPLAHLALPLVGKGNVLFKGKDMPSAQAMQLLGWEPIVLGAKDGLALLNGTQFMTALALHAWWRSEIALKWAHVCAAVSLEAFHGTQTAYLPALQQARPHPGQIVSAQWMRQLLSGSGIQALPKTHVQDPYSFRCVPQVYGASLEALWRAGEVFETECKSATDNPMVFIEADSILSGGNFHGQPLALQMDFMCLAMAEIASLSERRIYQLVSGKRHLPDFLTPQPGLQSGFMILQYAAASAVSQNKGLCFPASVDTIDSSKGQEDHVSMGANAGLKWHQLMDNVEQVLAMELLTAFQALDFTPEVVSGEWIESLRKSYRTHIPFLTNDAEMHLYIKESIRWMRDHQIDCDQFLQDP